MISSLAHTLEKYVEKDDFFKKKNNNNNNNNCYYIINEGFLIRKVLQLLLLKII